MKLSEERVTFLSHQIFKALKGSCRFADESKGLAGIKQAIHEYGAVLGAIDTHVREKIASLKRQILDGSREWDLIYRQYFDEELKKKGL